MTQPSGWYEDPKDASQLRYWDGVVWSNNVSPKVSPTVAQSTIGMPYGVTATSARPASAGAHGPQGSTPQDRQDRGQPGGQWPPYGQGSGSGGAQLGWQANPTTTPDGVPLAAWWPRAGARVLDGIFTFVLALPLTGYGYYRYIDGVLTWSRDLAAQSASGAAPVLALPPWSVYQFAFAASVIGLLVSVAYECFFLMRSGATPGKKIVGISVRLRDQAGPPPRRAVLLRAGCYYGFSLVSVANLLDILWPLWDEKKQAIHDKVAATTVVVGPQPKRDI
jgi:uncharacterized RDD family membrane protein YckC